MLLLQFRRGSSHAGRRCSTGSADRDRFIEDGLWAICERCWDSDPDKRPRITDIVKDLEDIKKRVDRWEGLWRADYVGWI